MVVQFVFDIIQDGWKAGGSALQPRKKVPYWACGVCEDRGGVGVRGPQQKQKHPPRRKNEREGLTMVMHVSINQRKAASEKILVGSG